MHIFNVFTRTTIFHICDSANAYQIQSFLMSVVKCNKLLRVLLGDDISDHTFDDSRALRNNWISGGCVNQISKFSVIVHLPNRFA